MPGEDLIFDQQAAAHYEDWYGTPEGRRADVLEKAALQALLEHFSAAATVLEIGCGTGHFTRWLDEQQLAAVGVDISAAMLGQAQALDSPPLVQGDAVRLPFADRTFDLTAMITTLEFLRQPDVVLAEALRVSRHGLLLGVLNRWSVMGLWRQLVGFFRPTVYDAARFYGVQELARRLQRVAQGAGRVSWRTTLFPRWWSWARHDLPWGGFIAMAMTLDADEPMTA